MREQRGVISYSPQCLSVSLSLCVCVCLSLSLSFNTKVAVGLFKSKSSTHFPAQFSNTPNTRMPLLLGDTPNTHAQHTHAAALGRHAQYTRAAPNRLPLVLGVVGTEGVCSKSKLPTTRNHNHVRRAALTAPTGSKHYTAGHSTSTGMLGARSRGTRLATGLRA